MFSFNSLPTGDIAMRYEIWEIYTKKGRLKETRKFDAPHHFEISVSLPEYVSMSNINFN